MDLTVVMPAWNEAENLRVLIPELREAVAQIADVTDYEVLVVDKGSSDDTQEVARALGCRVVVQEQPGYGGAYRAGFAEATAPFVFTLDTDLSHPPSCMQSMWDKRHEADVVIASRYVPGARVDQPKFRLLLSRVLNTFFGELLALPAGDVSGGYRLYRKSVLDGFETTCRNFDVQQELLVEAVARGARVAEVPIHYRERGAGDSHAQILQFGIGYIKLMWRLFFVRLPLFSDQPARRFVPYLLLLAFLVCTAYASTLGHGFVRWDDNFTIYENPMVAELDWAAIKRAFNPFVSRARYEHQYTPLTSLSYVLDYHVLGAHAKWFHATSVLWHLLAVLFTFAAVERWTRSAGVGFVSAAVVGLHPVAVEAATWLSGRDAAMCLAFSMMALWAWLRSWQPFRPAMYVASALLLGCALLSKQNAVLLPLVMVLCAASQRFERPPARRGWRIAWLALPHTAVAAGLGWVALWVAQNEGVFRAHRTTLELVQAPFVGIAYYVRMFLVPLGLRPSYQLQFGSFELWAVVGLGGAAVIGAAVIAYKWRRSWPALSAALLAALCMLAPALTGRGTQWVADRYLYMALPFLGALVGLAIGAVGAAGRNPATAVAEMAVVRRRRLVSALSAVLLCGSFWLTLNQNRIWANDITLWDHALAIDANQPAGHRYRAYALRDAERFEEAEQELRALLAGAWGPPAPSDNDVAYIQAALGEVLEQREQIAEAELWLRKAQALHPNSERIDVKLGMFYERQDRIDDAAAAYEHAIRANANSRVARARLQQLDR